MLTIRTTFPSIIKGDDVRSLWRGYSMNVIKISLETDLRRISHKSVKRLFGQTIEHEISVVKKFSCSSAASFTKSGLIHPMKTAKISEYGVLISIYNFSIL